MFCKGWILTDNRMSLWLIPLKVFPRPQYSVRQEKGTRSIIGHWHFPLMIDEEKNHSGPSAGMKGTWNLNLCEEETESPSKQTVFERTWNRQIQYKLSPQVLGKLGLPFLWHSGTQEGTRSLGPIPGFQPTALNLLTSCEIKCVWAQQFFFQSKYNKRENYRVSLVSTVSGNFCFHITRTC